MKWTKSVKSVVVGILDFGLWTFASTGKVHFYCRSCRQQRANIYNQGKRQNGGTHTKRQWLEKLEIIHDVLCVKDYGQQFLLDRISDTNISGQRII